MDFFLAILCTCINLLIGNSTVFILLPELSLYFLANNLIIILLYSYIFYKIIINPKKIYYFKIDFMGNIFVSDRQCLLFVVL